MRCFSCNKLSLEPICKECEQEFLTPEMIEEEIGNLEVVSFFDYYLTVDFIKSKYISSGYRIYKFLAKNYFKQFLKAYTENIDSNILYVIGVDENVDRGYSNVALLTHYSTQNNPKTIPLHNALKARNRVQYAGKSLEFRLDNPRDFIYKGPENVDAIIIDDTTTTGTTLEQAYRVLKQHNVNVHFALTLANAKEGMDY